MAGRTGLTASLRHRDFRLLLSAFALSAIGTWAYNVALVVYVFDATKSVAWVAAATICRLVPALLVSSYGGVLADRFERVRLMVSLDLVCMLMMVGLSAEMLLSAPVGAVIATAAATATVGTVYEPAAVAMTPLAVKEADLASANALRNTVDNIAVFVGPGIGAALLLVGPPSVAVALNACSFLASALLLVRLRVRSKPVDVTEGGTQGPVAQMLVGMKVISSSPTISVLVGYSVLATFVFGVDTVLLVALSDQILGSGPDGFGYLLAGLGVGGVAAAGTIPRLERRPRLGPVILAGMALYVLPTLLFVVTTSQVVGFFLQVVRGAGTLVVDVLAVTALQRTLPNEVLARVFGAFNTLILGAAIVGSLLAPLSITGFGLTTTIWLSSVGLAVVSLAGWPLLVRMDRVAAQRREVLAPKVRLLEACDLFAQVGDGTLDQLAATAEDVTFPPGQVVVGQGSAADAFYVVVNGCLSVTAIDESAATITLEPLGSGDYFGEIGLIEQIPRTATVTATTDVRLLRIDGPELLDALTAAAPSVALLNGAALRLRRTHPSLRPRNRGLAGGEPE